MKKDSSSKPVKIFGIGSAGIHAVARLMQRGLNGAGFAVVSTDANALAASDAPEKVALEAKALRALASGTDACERPVSDSQLAQFRAACAGVETMFVVAGLGGKTGTAISPLIAQIGKESGARVVGVVALPFHCEGSRRQEFARQGLIELTSIVDGVICLPNQRLFKLVDANTPLADAFKISDELLGDAVRGLWRLLSYKPLIEIDPAELFATVREHREENAFAVAEATGDNRALQVVERLLANPMLDGGDRLASSEKILISITGGPELTIAEVDQIMEHLSQRCDSTHVSMGAAVHDELRDRLSVVVIATGGDARLEQTSPRFKSSAGDPPKAAPIREQLLSPKFTSSPKSRVVAPSPATTPEQVQQLMNRPLTGGGRGRKSANKMRQGQLPLDIVSKGRFDKSEPTLYKGEDLDMPTYIRRGIVLN